MMLGMSLEVFTLVHVIISIIAIGAGFGVLYGLLHSVWSGPWTAVFLLFTVLTNVTGLMFPFNGFLPSHAVAILSLVLLAVALFALYGRHIAGPWRAAYIITAMLSLYLNVFVLFAQMFNRLPQLKALAPNGSEPPFGITQGLVLVVFIWLIYAAVKSFRRAGVERR
jgi:hypothetical protein